MEIDTDNSLISNSPFTNNGLTTTDCGNYVSDALVAIRIHFIHNNQKKITFFPKMAHQIFGNDELVFGYSNLTIDITYCGVSGHSLLECKYSAKIEDKGLLLADNIQDKIREWIPNICLNSKKFEKLSKTNTNTTGYGIAFNKFKVHANGQTFDCSIHLCDLSDNEFIEFHERFQSLIVFFIDAASYINLLDKNWTILYLYLERNLQNKSMRFPIGFLTIYKFVTPKITRSRISQVFIIPPYQRLGLGTKLLEAAYEFINSCADVDEITVESPSAEFTRLRDNCDLKLLTALPEFSKKNILKGYTPRMPQIARKLFKINRTQCAHLYDILKHHCEHNRVENVEDSERLYKDLRKRFKVSYAVKCKRKIAKRMKNLVCIQNLIDDFDVDEKLRDYLTNLEPAIKYLSNLSKK